MSGHLAAIARIFYINVFVVTEEARSFFVEVGRCISKNVAN